MTLTNGSSTAGGAIFNQGNLTLNSLWITGNTSSGLSGSGGGGVSNNGGTLAINSSTISGNTATSAGTGGGGLEVNGGTVTITNSTFTGNSSTGNRGGAIWIHGTTPVVAVLSATITGNTAASVRPGIWMESGTLAIGNSVVAGNAPATASSEDIQGSSGTLNSNGFNFIGAIGTGFTSNVANGVNHDQLGIAGTPLNPLMGTLQVPPDNVAGMPPTIFPQTGSPLDRRRRRAGPDH